MKKRLVALLTAALICVMPFAAYAGEIDLSGMSFEELQDLQLKLTQAIWESDGWQEVRVPAGVYQVGEEIPAGKWTITKAAEDYAYFRVANEYRDGEIHHFTVTSDLETELNIIVEDGQYIEVSNNPVVFTPYVASFSFK